MAKFHVMATKQVEVILTIESDTRDKDELTLDTLKALDSSTDWKATHLSMTIHEIMAKDDDVIFFSLSFDLHE
jgi:hypothetical protein